jgi:hypothetical protein
VDHVPCSDRAPAAGILPQHAARSDHLLAIAIIEKSWPLLSQYMPSLPYRICIIQLLQALLHSRRPSEMSSRICLTSIATYSTPLAISSTYILRPDLPIILPRKFIGNRLQVLNTRSMTRKQSLELSWLQATHRTPCPFPVCF